MRGYGGINSSLSCCVHFVRNDEIDDSLEAMLNELRRESIKVVYIDYLDVVNHSQSVVGTISTMLNLPNGPHTDDTLWSFLDDLITCSSSLDGLVIVVDAADKYLDKQSRSFFDLIEAFLVQIHHWLQKKKPCHLCFQMEMNLNIKELFKQFG